MAVTEGKVSVTEGSGKNLETTTVTTGAGIVEREVTVLADPETVAARAKVASADPGAADYGLVVRNLPSGTQPVSAVALPLPAGAALEAGNLAAIAASVAASATAAAIAAVKQDNRDVLVGILKELQALRRIMGRATGQHVAGLETFQDDAA